MTVSSTATRIAYTGNASTTAFPFSFRFLATTDIAVYVDGVLQSTGYTVSSPGASGTVTFSTAPASGVSVVITRATAKTQETDYVANDAFSADSTELAFDRAMLVSQDNAAAIGRVLRVADHLPAIGSLDLASNPNTLIGTSGSGVQFYPISTGVNGLQLSDAPTTASYMINVVSPGTHIDNVLYLRNQSYYATTTPADGRTAARGNAAMTFKTAWGQERGAIGYSAPAVGFDPTNLTMGAQFLANVVYLEASNLVGASQPDGAPDILLCVTMAAGDPFFPGTFYKPFEHDSSVGTTYLRARASGGGYGTIGFEGNGIFGNVGVIASNQLGMQTTWARLRERVASDQFAITTNLLDGGTQDNAAKASWSVAFGAGQDAFKVSRSPAGSGSLVDLLTADVDRITFGKYTKYTTKAVASLVAAATAGAGARDFVSDSSVAGSGNFGAIVAGGGANAVPVYCDGTNWRIG